MLLAAAMGSSLGVGAPRRRTVNPVPRRLATRARAKSTARLHATVRSRSRGCATWSNGGAASARRRSPAGLTPRSRSPGRCSTRREAEAVRRAILVRLGDAGPRGRRLRARNSRRRRRRHACAVSSCTTALHLALLARRRRAGRRGGDGQPFVRRDGQRDPLLRRRAGVRRHRARHLQHRPAGGRGEHRAADAGDPLRAPDGHAVRPRGDLEHRARGHGCRSSRTPPARSAARFAGTAPGSRSAARTATSRASRSTRASSSRPATAGC